MFGEKYSRLEFWVISVCLFTVTAIVNFFAKAMENSGQNYNEIGTFSIIFVLTIIWINTLSNRIRDYGSNPWIALFSLIPLVNIGLSLFYGSINKKKSPIQESDFKDSDKTSLTKAVINHSKDIVNEIKPAINEYKEKHSSSKEVTNNSNILSTEDEIYERIMIEIEENNKVKSSWAKALAQSDGDKDKAESLYINMRFEDIQNSKIIDKTANLSSFCGSCGEKLEKNSIFCGNCGTKII